jgi:hypothetical protein
MLCDDSFATYYVMRRRSMIFLGGPGAIFGPACLRKICLTVRCVKYLHISFRLKCYVMTRFVT